MYEPKLPHLLIVKSRLSSSSWARRVRAAQTAMVHMEKVANLIDAGVGTNEAIRQTVVASRRSWVFRQLEAFREHGMEALIDGRLPRDAGSWKRCEALIETARDANPKVAVEDVLRILLQHDVRVLPTEARIRRCFARVDARKRRSGPKSNYVEIIELPDAGGELLLAAEVETAAIGALTNVVVAMGEEARQASLGKSHTPDLERRDELGHFTVEYNAARRRRPGEAVAGYLRSAAEKAEGRMPAWARFTNESRESLERKLRTMVLAPLVCETKGWDALRSDRAAGLGVLTGFPYMPSTLAKFTSALAINGASPRLLAAVGVNWHRVAQGTWKEPGAAAAMYIDNQVKEVWSSLFTKSGKVSHLSRVMPCITTTYVHTGAGTPIVISVQSGGAPLAPRIVDIVEKVDKQLGDVGRMVVIDSEGSVFDILKTFADRHRAIVTPLRPSRTPDVELSYTRGSYFRPYRDHDEIRVASVVLTHKSTERSIELGAVIVRREHRERDTILLTTGLGLGMEGRDVADLYYSRWPVQENAFKDGIAVDLNEHRGNCSRMVANVAVETELERLFRREASDRPKLSRLQTAEGPLQSAAQVAFREHQHATSALATRRKRLDKLVDAGRRDGRMLASAAIEHRDALLREEAASRIAAETETALRENATRRARLESGLAAGEEQRLKLEPRRQIREIDVAQDGILTATKLTLSLLITFVLREYLPTMAMSPPTFVSRVFGLLGRRELHSTEERIVFYENPRDPAINNAMADACRRLNQRQLQRDGRSLRYSTEPSKNAP